MSEVSGHKSGARRAVGASRTQVHRRAVLNPHSTDEPPNCTALTCTVAEPPLDGIVPTVRQR
jgi:hypothetical protein